MRLELRGDEREVLFRELTGIVETTAALYGQIGRQWDPRDASALGPEVAPVVRARDQLHGAGPWHIEGTPDELAFLLGRLRAGAELALQRGAQPSPAGRTVAMNTADTESTDAQLDVLRVSDVLLRRLRGTQAG